MAIRLSWTSTVLGILILMSGCKPDSFGTNGADDASMVKFFPENLASVEDLVTWQSVDDDNAVVSISAKDLMTQTITIDRQPYTQIRLPGFKSESQRGSPEIPGITFLIRIPPGKTL